MLRWGFVWFGFAVASGLVGASVHDARTFALAQILFFGSVVMFVVFTLLGTVLPHPIDARRSDALPRRDEWFER
ncbi:MAG: hypothetical protein JSS46_08300 [Proteobacteria bacterium]|jgi:uncharacterized membrane protein YtjA (UPF0391 family)|nr:hypothetical protein [Pseudomonadota bacterium]